MQILKGSKRRPTARGQFEVLEPRNLLTAFVLNDGSATLLGTLPGKSVSISGESAARGPALQAMVNWGDGTSSAATLVRLPNGRLQVVAGHAYTATKTYHLTITTDAGGVTKTALKRPAHVLLNAFRGRTIKTVAGETFDGVVGTAQRSGHLPRITMPADAVFLPQGMAFGQYTVGSDAQAIFRVDWGDGTVTDATVVSNGHGDYSVLGSHTYATAGAYRVITNIVIRTVNGSLLHIDQIDSTAHVENAATDHSGFALPSHVALDLSQILPPIDLTNTGGDPGTSGGSGGSVTIWNGDGAGSNSSGGILNLGGGAGDGTFSGTLTTAPGGGSGFVNLGNSSGSGTITLVGNSTLGSGGIITGGTLILGSGGGNLITGSTDSGSGSIVLTGTTSIPTLLLTANFDPSQGTGVTGTQINLYLTGNPLTDPSTVRLLGQTSWNFHADGTLSIASTNDVVKISNSFDVLAHLTGGAITFDSDVTSSQIVAAAGALPGGFVGTVTLPYYIGDLAVWPTGATVNQPSAPPPIETPADTAPDSTT